MANSVKGASPGGAAKDAMPYEDALKQLETIVEEMESGELALEAMVKRFEEGIKLVKHCQGRLEEAEARIQKLEKAASGDLVLKPLTESSDE